MSTDKAYARCSACNKSFYPAWRSDIETFEDLCWTCQKVSQYTAQVDPILYGTKGIDQDSVHPDRWEQSQGEQTKEYINGITSVECIPDSLAEIDEWTAGTGFESGEWFGNNNPFDTYEV